MAHSFTPICRKFIKKQSVPFQLVIQDEVDAVCSDPQIGEIKKGDLADLKVRKFSFKKQLYLMAYRTEGEDIIFCMIGTHENFYRDLKKYLREE